MPATVTDLSPQPGGKATAVYPTVTVGILDRDTSVDTGSITLCLDGPRRTRITNISKQGANVVIAYEMWDHAWADAGLDQGGGSRQP